MSVNVSDASPHDSMGLDERQHFVVGHPNNLGEIIQSLQESSLNLAAAARDVLEIGGAAACVGQPFGGFGLNFFHAPAYPLPTHFCNKIRPRTKAPQGFPVGLLVRTVDTGKLLIMQDYPITPMLQFQMFSYLAVGGYVHLQRAHSGLSQNSISRGKSCCLVRSIPSRGAAARVLLVLGMVVAPCYWL